MEIEYRPIPEDEIDRDLFADFIRHQVVDVCLRREGENWVERSDPFIDDWGEEEYADYVHLTERGFERLGRHVAETIRNALNR